ncbi:MAG TPA: gamma-glutamylcyclotransferase [Sedimenticola thiotaurini]|uniref:Gamma-glutamylcyclotransferase n=1 Tax=Sedimenticola thiotaurini TaxID=1543721 RepID=A0A831RLH0_9GAMM|nr:gamma-glutamylcyclotransferase [Sedimenticola thiotaurini]
MLYFSYGSNMSSRRLLARVPSARFVTVAVLPGHHLLFHKIGRDGSAKCDAAVAGGGQRVIGVVFDIAAREKPLLDRKEGLGNGYEQKWVRLTGAGGDPLEAVTYYATHTDPALRPFHWYKSHVLLGAREHRLPAAYVARIEAVEAIDDPDGERHRRELAIYADMAGGVP